MREGESEVRGWIDRAVMEYCFMWRAFGCLYVDMPKPSARKRGGMGEDGVSESLFVLVLRWNDGAFVVCVLFC
jgi:hypothetical protein